MNENNESAPHVGVINLSIAIHPVSPKGEINAIQLNRNKLKELGIKNKLITVKGASAQEVADKIKQILEELSKWN